MDKNRNKESELSSRGRAESSDVVISCDKKLSFLARCCASKKQRLSSLVRRKSERQAIFEFVLPLASKGIEGIKYIFNIFTYRKAQNNLIRRSLEFFAFAQVAPAKNRDDFSLFNKTKEAAHCVTDVTAPEQGSLDEVTRRAPRGMTFSTLAIAAVLAIANISESWAATEKKVYDDNGRVVVYTDSDGVGYKYTYDLNGNIVLEEYYQHCDGLVCINKGGEGIYNYNSDNTMSIAKYSCKSGNCSKYSETYYTYPNENTQKTEIFDCSLGICNKTFETYSTNIDENTNIKENYRDCDTPKGCRKYDELITTYDNNGNEKSVKSCSSISSNGSCSNYYSANYTYDYDEFGNIINKYRNGELEETREYSDGYYVKLENECNQSGNCKACTKWSTFEGTRCVPGYEWLDDKTLAINDDLPEITRDIFGLSSGMPEKILCRGDVAKCKELLRNYPIYSGGGNPYGYGSSDYYPGYSAPYGGEYLNVDLGDYVEPATETNCESSRYYWSGSSCNNKNNGINCDENFKQMETWCNRIRYTPADAAKVLKDTDNEIVMTFKVNR